MATVAAAGAAAAASATTAAVVAVEEEEEEATTTYNNHNSSTTTTTTKNNNNKTVSKSSSVESTTKLTCVATNVYTLLYPIHFGGCEFFSRMTIVRLNDGSNSLWIHSPCEITKKEIQDMIVKQFGGTSSNTITVTVKYIVAPGNYHHLHVKSCQDEYPDAKTYISPGIESKRPDLKYDVILNDDSDSQRTPFSNEIEHVILSGNSIINEIVFYHKCSKTLIVVDSIEYIGDQTVEKYGTSSTNWILRFFWKYVLKMWNVPKPAPEYQIGWFLRKMSCTTKGGLEESKRCMEKILEWDFERVILAHGDNIETTHGGESAKDVVKRAWKGILGE